MALSLLLVVQRIAPGQFGSEAVSMRFFFPEGQEVHINVTKNYYKANDFYVFFKPVVNFPDFLDILCQQNLTASVFFLQGKNMQQSFSARKRAGLPKDATATPSNALFPARSGSQRQTDIDNGQCSCRGLPLMMMCVLFLAWGICWRPTQYLTRWYLL